MRLKAVIIDDEFHARENLRLLIEEYCPSMDVMGEGSDISSGLEAINKYEPDVVFLDIRMPSGSEGFELLKELDRPSFMVVFVTAFKDYAIDAFKVNAVDYILKPIDIDELVATAERLEERHKNFKQYREKAELYREKLERLSIEMTSGSQKLTISHASGIKVINIKDIVALKAEGNCSRLIFKDGSHYLDTRTLKYYQTVLEDQGFFRIHRSYLINLKELDELTRNEGNNVVMSNGTRFPVARSAMSGLLAIMDKL
ncbi:MAG: response regulator transcription factor [Flavobacteriales bacterium]|nr:response regulator transcription factor [Flavobacteriales bacterium]